MKNGIKSIYDYFGRERYEARHNDSARITFLEPCFPQLYVPSRESDYWELHWTVHIPTEEDHWTNKWAMVYDDNLYQVIKFEDGTEMVVRGERRAEDMQKLKEYIARGYETDSELSKAAHLLDDDMMYEI